jgi:hypothetical protein
MWTEAHRARHDARLKEIVSMNAVGQVARPISFACRAMPFTEPIERL